MAKETIMAANTEWLSFKSRKNSTYDDILIKRDLIKAYIIQGAMDRDSGCVNLKIFWDKDQVTEGWVPEAFID